jgi:hypothetical protein
MPHYRGSCAPNDERNSMSNKHTHNYNTCKYSAKNAQLKHAEMYLLLIKTCYHAPFKGITSSYYLLSFIVNCKIHDTQVVIH